MVTIMKRSDQHTEKSRGRTRSSIAVSRETVCTDEACIGKTVKVDDASPSDQTQARRKEEKSPGSSISVGGKEVCADDACIGKK